MSHQTPHTEYVSICVDYVTSDTASTALTRLAQHAIETQGQLLVRPSGPEQVSGSYQFWNDGLLFYEATVAATVEQVLVDLQEKVGA